MILQTSPSSTSTSLNVWNYSKKYNYHYFDNDNQSVVNFNEEKESTNLAVFNFYGTLVWSERGERVSFNPEELVLSSPFVDIIFDSLKFKGYKLCIIEICRNKSSIEKTKRCISDYLIKNKIFIPAIVCSSTEYIENILCHHFDTDHFGHKSLYCGDHLDLYHFNPWYRISNMHTEIAKELNFRIYSPEEVFGSFISTFYYFTVNKVVVSCGQKYSGFDLVYASLDNETTFKGMTCKYRLFSNKKIYFIMDYNFESFLESNETITVEDESNYVILGSHPLHKDRTAVFDKFRYKDGQRVENVVAWYSRPPYEWTETYKNYVKSFEPPNKTGEKWFRIN